MPEDFSMYKGDPGVIPFNEGMNDGSILDTYSEECFYICEEAGRQTGIDIHSTSPDWPAYFEALRKLPYERAFALFMAMVHKADQDELWTDPLSEDEEWLEEGLEDEKFVHPLLIQRIAQERTEPLFSIVAQYVRSPRKTKGTPSIKRTQRTFNSYIQDNRDVRAVSSDAIAVETPTGKIEAIALHKDVKTVRCADLFERADSLSLEEIFSVLQSLKKKHATVSNIPVSIPQSKLKKLHEVIDTVASYPQTINWDNLIRQFELRNDGLQVWFEENLHTIQEEFSDLIAALQEAGFYEEFSEYTVELPRPLYSIEDIAHMPELVPFEFDSDDKVLGLRSVYDTVVFSAVEGVFGEAFRHIPLRAQVHVIQYLLHGNKKQIQKMTTALNAPGVDAQAVLAAGFGAADDTLNSIMHVIYVPGHFPADMRAVPLGPAARNKIISAICREYTRVLESINRFSYENYGDKARAVAQRFTARAEELLRKALWIDVSYIEETGLTDINGEVLAFASMLEEASPQDREAILEKGTETHTDILRAEDLTSHLKKQMVAIHIRNYGESSHLTQAFKKKLEEPLAGQEYHCVFFGVELIEFLCVEDREDDVYVSSLNLDPDAQGVGAGSAFMRMIWRNVEKRGKTITAESRAHREVTPQYVERLGFIVDNVRMHEGEAEQYAILHLRREITEDAFTSKRYSMEKVKALIQNIPGVPIQDGNSQVYWLLVNRKGNPHELADVYDNAFKEGYVLTRLIPCGGFEVQLFEKNS